MLNRYFQSLYQDAIGRAYETAYGLIAASAGPEALILDCGAHNGRNMDLILRRTGLDRKQLHGIEWNESCADEGRRRGLNIARGDLNRGIAADNGQYSCVHALSVLEHLLNPCRFLKECRRVLRPGGQLILLTPNISTYFTAALILAGKMPSSGPHPDSEALLAAAAILGEKAGTPPPDVEGDTPVHRHLVVFSYRVLGQYLRMLDFSGVSGRGFGLYPFPIFMQPPLERLDPWHCHQMVFVATK